MSAVERVIFERGRRLDSADLTDLFQALDRGLSGHLRSAHGSRGVLIGLEPRLTAPADAPRTVTVTPGVAADADGELLVLSAPHTLFPGEAPATVVLRAVGPGPQARPWLLGPHTPPDPRTDVVLGRVTATSTEVETAGLRQVARRLGTTQLLAGRLSQATAQVSGTPLRWSATVFLPYELAAPPSVMASLVGPPPVAAITTTIAVTARARDSFTLLVRHGRRTGEHAPSEPLTKVPVDIVWTAVVDVPPVAVGSAPPPSDAPEHLALPRERATTMTVNDPIAPLPSVSRPVFFEHQLLTAADLTELAEAERALRRLHHRTLHGWGISRGMEVTGAVGDARLVVAPGYALDAAGRELLLTAPVELDVPAVAGEPAGPAEEFLLVVRWTEDEEAAARLREGAGGTFGAVRLDDNPTLQWLPDKSVRNGFDLVLAGVKVRDCRLAEPPDGSARRLLKVSPHVASGSTEPGATQWTLVKNASGSVLGVKTNVDTRSGGFTGPPTYLVRLEGLRDTQMPGENPPKAAVLDGNPYVANSGVQTLTVVVPLHPGVTADQPRPDGQEVDTVPLNPPKLLGDDLPELVGTDLRWSVAWVGVES
ncbi:hypothetical protein [Streptomyces sp. NPDC000410]|uniref:hypothetical protein n=1 Tax=Streptomyces sp. NPDC000410 TaxID=3154254 RepID=UPI0033233E29